MEHHSFSLILKQTRGKTYFHERILSLIKDKSRNEDTIALLESEDILNSFESSGQTLLHLAAQYDNYEIVEYLVRFGCPVDAYNNLGKTPLIVAMENYCQRSANILLKANADIYIPDNSGKNALYWILDINWVNEVWYLPSLVLEPLKSQCDFNSETVADELFDIGWQIPHAVILRDIEITKMMLERGCGVDECEPKDGRTGLHVAVMTLDVEHVKLLLDNHADPNAEDYMGETPLSMIPGPLRGKPHNDERAEIVKMLIDRGASRFTRKSQGNCALKFGDRRVIEVLLQVNLDLSAQDDEEGDTPLHVLALNKNPDAFKALTGHVFDVDVRNYSDETPLSIAAFHGNICAVEFFLEIGADVDALDINCYTPLQRCVASYCQDDCAHEACIQHLLENNADIANASSVDHSTAFDVDVDDIDKMHVVGELLVAHVALQTALGIPVAEIIDRKIRQCEIYKDYYELYKQRLAAELYESVTLLDLLRLDDLQFERQVRNKELASSIERFNDKSEKNLRYFNTILRKRYSKAVRLMKLREKVAYQLFLIMELDYNFLIGDRIVSYLDAQDLQNFLEVKA